MEIYIETDKLCAEIEALATISSCEAPGVTRVLFSEEDLRAREFLRELADEAGFTFRQDAVGNIFIRWQGEDVNAPAVGTGSHTDAIPNAGKFDGVVGVLGGIEAMRALKRSGFQPKHSIETLMFASEEPTRFGIGCLGSRLLSGSISPAQALALRDADDKSLSNWLQDLAWCNGVEADLLATRLPKGYYRDFIELHIEQGPILERENLQIGIVEKIAAPASFKLNLEGEGGHAGAVLMPGRRDAGLAAAEIALAVEKGALESGSADTVGTTGMLKIFPCAVNSIPAKAYMEVDFRDTDIRARDAALKKIRKEAEGFCKVRSVSMTWDWINKDDPAICSQELVLETVQICEQLHYSNKTMISRAYHDSLFMARLFPTLMIFIPSYKGYSHRPDEYTSPTEIECGIKVLANILAKRSK